MGRSIHLGVGDKVADRTIVEIAPYNERFDTISIKFDDGKYAVYCGSTWVGGSGEWDCLLRSGDNEECNRLLAQAVTMPELYYSRRECFVVEFRRRASRLRNVRKVRLAFHHGESKDFHGQKDEVLMS